MNEAAVTRLAETIRDCFDRGDYSTLVKLIHPGQNEAACKNNEEYARKLMEWGCKVMFWKISRWKQPNWEVFKSYRFYPQPVAIIDMQLRSPGGGEMDFYVACAPADDGYKSCYYVAKHGDVALNR